MTIIWRQPPRIISDDRLIGSPVRQTDRQVTRQTLSKIGKNYMKNEKTTTNFNINMTTNHKNNKQHPVVRKTKLIFYLHDTCQK